MANAITEKGVTTAADATFAVMGANILSIQSGESSNGRTWTKCSLDSGTGGKFRTLFNSQGIWISSCSNKTFISTNGKTWRMIAVSDFKAICKMKDVIIGALEYDGVTYSIDNGSTWMWGDLDGGTFNTVATNGSICVVGGDSDGIYYSSDGVSWLKTNVMSGPINSICYGDGVWVAVGSNGLYYSTDGIVWNESTSLIVDDLKHVYYSEGNWIVIPGSQSGLYQTKNPMGSFTKVTTPYMINTIYHANGMWVVGGDGNILYSTAIGSWKESTAAKYDMITCLYYANGMWVAGGYDQAYYSPDGMNWSTEGDGFGFTCNCVLNACGIWVLATDNGLYYSV